MPPIAFITGITGQDGSYLAELLLSKGYIVHGLIRRSSNFHTQRIDHLYEEPQTPSANLHLHYGDLTDSSRLTNLFYELRPDEIYHLGAQSHVRVSFDLPDMTADSTALGTTRLLEAIRCSGLKSRIYQAASSEMFGGTAPPQNEQAGFQPRSPYAISKLYAYWMTRNYREAYNLYACNGILFNHESPRRGATFVSRKISRAVANIKAGKQQHLYLGNLEAKRDWGYAPEYIECMWKMLQQERPEDYVVGTGQTHTVEEFVTEAFSYVGLDWREYVKFDPRYLRPTEVDVLLADSSKARKQLDWQATVGFSDLVKIMVDADLEMIGLESPGAGKKSLEGRFTWKLRP